MYTVIKQKGEMSWGQPRYGITPTEEEKSRFVGAISNWGYAKLLLRKEDFKATLENLTTGESDSHTYSIEKWADYSPEKNELMLDINSFADVELYANYFGDRMDASFFERYSKILVKS